MKRLLCLGLGYSAEALAGRLVPHGWRITGTSRTPLGAARLAAMGYAGHIFDGDNVRAGLATAIDTATHLLVSIAPGSTSDPVLSACRDQLAAAPRLQWIGYLSSIGVYGDSGGAWVDEETPPAPRQERSIRRLEAETTWLDFGAATQRSVARKPGFSF